MGIVASVYGCLKYSKELTLENDGDAVVHEIGDEFRKTLEVYGCFMQTIFQVSVNTKTQEFAL